MIERAGAVTAQLAGVWRHAIDDVAGRRGGSRYLEDVLGGVEPEAMLSSFAAAGSLWSDDAASIMIVSHRLILALYVDPAHRRQGRGRALVTLARQEANARDALALPGDRAMKSLYESVGWKARLLTLGDE